MKNQLFSKFKKALIVLIVAFMMPLSARTISAEDKNIAKDKEFYFDDTITFSETDERWIYYDYNGSISKQQPVSGKYALEKLDDLDNGYYTVEFKRIEDGKSYYLVLPKKGPFDNLTGIRKISGTGTSDDPYRFECIAPYNITIDQNIINGTVASDLQKAEKGEIVTLTVTPSGGYGVGDVTVSDAGSVTKVSKNKYTFVMPETNVTASATFTKLNHVHDSVSFEEWTSTDSLPNESGSYYLSNDVSIRDTWVVDKNIDLCLNGHSITMTETAYAIKVVNNAVLNIYDCQNDTGTITHTSGVKGTGIYLGAAEMSTITQKGTVNFYGGKISGNNGHGFGGGVYITNQSNFNMFGGSIDNNYAPSGGGGIYAYGHVSVNGGTITNNRVDEGKTGGGIEITADSASNGGLSVSGNVTISGNKSGNNPNNVNLYYTNIIKVIGPLNDASSIGVTTSYPPTTGNPTVITSGLGKSKNVFFSDNEDYFTTKNSNNEAQLNLVEKYGLWVGGVQVTEANKDNIPGTDKGKASYDPDTKTLTLDGATISKTNPNEGTYTECIFTRDDLIIKVKDGTENFIGNSTSGSGIFVHKDLKIKGKGSLTITAVGEGDCAIVCDNAYISDVNLIASANGNDSIYSLDGVSISSGTVNSVSNGSNNSGIYAEYGDITIGTNVNLIATGTKAALTGNVINSNVGTGWTDVEGTQGKESIPASSTGQTLAYKKVQFPSEGAYPLWVSGIQVTEDNKDDVLGEADTGATVSFTPAQGTTPATLTLNGASITGAYKYYVDSDSDAAIYSSGMDLIIVANGNNEIGNANIETGIYIREKDETGGGLSIKGNGSLNVRGRSDAIFVDGDLNINDENCTITAIADGDNCSNGIYCWGNISITVGTLTAKANGKEAIYAGGEAIINSGTVTAGPSDGHAVLNGIHTSNGSITIGENVILTAAGIQRALYAYEHKIINKNPGTGWIYEGGKKVEKAIDISKTGQVLPDYIEVKFPTIIEYPLWVGETRVTNINENDVLDDGKISYTPATDETPAILTLKGAAISDTHGFRFEGQDNAACIYSTENLIIKLENENTINNTTDGSGIFVEGDLTIQGDGTLTANTVSQGDAPVFCVGDLTISDGNITATSSGAKSAAIYSRKDININGGTVIATASGADSDGICTTDTGVINIGEGVIFLTASGSNQAIYGKVKNAIVGIGFENIYVYEVEKTIPISTEGRTLNYKKVQFTTITQYDLWVGGIRVTNLNANDIFGDGKASFDPDTSTLTLNGASITKSNVDGKPQKAGIYSSLSNGLTIIVESDSSVDVEEAYYGIVNNNGDLTIKGNGILIVKGKDAIGSTNGQLIIQNTTVTATGDIESSSNTFNGIYSYGKMTITNSTLTATGFRNGIGSDGGIDIDDSTVTAKSRGYGIYSSGKIDIKGAESVVTAESITKGGSAITSDKNLSINGLSVIEPEGGRIGNGPGGSIGHDKPSVLDKDGNLAMKAVIKFVPYEIGKVWKTGETINLHGAWFIYSNTRLLKQRSVNQDATVPTDPNITPDFATFNNFLPVDKYVDNSDNEQFYPEIKYSPLEVAVPSDMQQNVKPLGIKLVKGNGTVSSPYEFEGVWPYSLWVGDTQVTSANASDVLNDGTVSFTPADDTAPATLTLNGANIDTGYTPDYFDHGIYYYGTDPLNVVLEPGTQNTIDNALYSGIYSKNADLSISGEGKLNIDVSDVGIYANGNITIDEATVIASAYTISLGFGIRVKENAIVNINGGKVIASGSASGIEGKVVNSIPGTGWTNTRGTQGERTIDVSSTGQDLSGYRKVQFQAIVTYPIWVGGKRVTSENLDDVTGDEAVSYDPDTMTLTLDNYSYTGDGYENSGICIRGDVDSNYTIALKGYNSITMKDSSANSYGIDSSGNLTIKGDGTSTLTVKSGNVPSGGSGSNCSVGINARTVTFDNVIVDVTGGDDNAFCDGINVEPFLKGNITVINSNVTARGYYGIYGHSTVKITDDGSGKTSLVAVGTTIAQGPGYYAVDDQDCRLDMPEGYAVYFGSDADSAVSYGINDGKLKNSDKDKYMKIAPAPAKTSYKVEHYQQNAEDDKYTLKETTIESEAMGGAEVTATPEVYEHFVFDKDNPNNVATGVVQQDGSLVLKLYYNRKTFNVTFKDDDGTVLQTSEMKYGSKPVYKGTPSKDSDKQYDYSFDYWEDEAGNKLIDDTTVEKAVTYTAVYESQIRKYNITFVDDDGTVLKEATEYEYGKTAAEIIKPDVPQKTDEQYTYKFDKWDPAVSSVTGDAVYKATYKKEIRKYKVTFYDDDRTTVLLETKEYNYGTKAENIAKPTVNSKTVSGIVYDFSNWNPAVGKVVSDADYYATYIEHKDLYTAEWIDIIYDEKTDTATSVSIKTDDEPKPLDKFVNPTVDNPHQQTRKYYWEFLDWGITLEGSKLTFTAYYAARDRRYLISFTDGDGNTLKTANLLLGTPISYDGVTPTKSDDEHYTYVFNNRWLPDLTSHTVVTKNQIFVAQFDKIPKKYKVKFIDENGNVLKGPDEYNYGTPVDKIVKPEVPQKSDAQYIYTFDKWEPDLSQVEKDVTYRAVYSKSLKKYNIKWLDDDGSLIDTTQVEYGTVPSHVALDDKVTPQYTYTFSKWEPNPVSVTGDAAYKASYTQTVNKYKIRFVDHFNTVEIEAEYGKAINDIKPKENPEGYEDPKAVYTFDHWEPKILMVSGDQTFTAVYNSTVKEYTVKFDMNGAESEAVKDQILEYDSRIEKPADPTRSDKTFAGWFTVDDNKWDFKTRIKGSLTLKAQWIEKSEVRTINGVEVSVATDDLQDKTVNNKYNDKPLMIITGNGVIVVPAGLGESVNIPKVDNGFVKIDLSNVISLTPRDHMYGIYLDVKKSDIHDNILAADKRNGYKETANSGFDAKFMEIYDNKGDVREYDYPGAVRITLDLEAMNIRPEEARDGYTRTHLVAHNNAGSNVEYLGLTLSADKKYGSFSVSTLSPFAFVFKDTERVKPSTPDYIPPRTGE